MALDLRESVAGFKLPEEEGHSHSGSSHASPASYDLASDADLDLDAGSLDDDTYPHQAKA
jgi:hypothetical protein